MISYIFFIDLGLEKQWVSVITWIRVVLSYLQWQQNMCLLYFHFAWFSCKFSLFILLLCQAIHLISRSIYLFIYIYIFNLTEYSFVALDGFIQVALAGLWSGLTTNQYLLLIDNLNQRVDCHLYWQFILFQNFTYLSSCLIFLVCLSFYFKWFILFLLRAYIHELSCPMLVYLFSTFPYESQLDEVRRLIIKLDVNENHYITPSSKSFSC